MGAMSNTCARVVPTTGAAARSAPYPAHAGGSWRTTTSGLATCRSVVPSRPAGPPGRRPDALRSDFGAGLPRPSEDGGLEEFREFDRTWASRSPTRAFNTRFSSRKTTISSSSAENSWVNAERCAFSTDTNSVSSE